MASCPCRHPTTALQAGCSSLPTTILAVILNSGPEIKNQCSLWAILEGFLASIPKSGPEIKNRCTQEGLNGEKLASIPKFGLEIKNRCSREGLNRENLAAIPKSGPEIRNHCSSGAVAFCRRNRSSLRQRKTESDADLVAATITAGGPFFDAATKNGHF